MPYKSRWSLPIPESSFPTWLFTSPSTDLGDAACYLDAASPEENFLTRNSFKLWSQRFALGLHRSGLFKEGDRVLVFSGNTLATPVAFMGTLMAGGIFTGANPLFTARELAYQLRDSGASILLCSDASIQTGIEAAKLSGLGQGRIFVFNKSFGKSSDSVSAEGLRYWSDLIAPAEEAKDYQWPQLTGPGECHTTLALNYSSGTTGVPKGVEITHYNYIANTLQFGFLSTLMPDYEERQKKARWLCYLPLYHAMAQTLYLAGGLRRQIPVYIMAKFDFVEVLANIQKFQITELALVPPIAVAFLKHPATKKYDLSSVSTASSGAAPLGREVCQQLEKIWDGKVNIKQGWGMTEVTCSLLGWDPRKHSDSFGVGEPNPNCEAKIVDIIEKPDGTQEFVEITQNGPQHRGELWCRGPNIMKGYWNNQTATANAFSPDGERWLRTGDVAYVDETGCFFIVDRIKELIKVKGNQVAPAELEALLLEHPDIADVAVVGKVTSEGDEKPCAFVQRQVGAKITKKEIEEFVKSKVVRYKWLAGGVEWIDAIPKNPSGKILRRQLKEVASQKGASASTRL